MWYEKLDTQRLSRAGNVLFVYFKLLGKNMMAGWLSRKFYFAQSSSSFSSSFLPSPHPKPFQSPPAKKLPSPNPLPNLFLSPLTLDIQIKCPRADLRAWTYDVRA